MTEEPLTDPHSAELDAVAEEIVRKHHASRQAKHQAEWEKKLAFRQAVMSQSAKAEPPPPPAPPRPINMQQASPNAVRTPWGWTRKAGGK